MAKKPIETEQVYSLDDTIQEWVIWVMRLSLIAASLYGLWRGNWELGFMSLLALVLTGLPLFVERRWQLRLPVEYELIVIGFIYAGIFLGEIGNAYERFWWWDMVLHVSSGVVLAFVGFLILSNLYYRRKLAASPFVLSCFTFSFGLAAGALWEIFEFAMDSSFDLNMQKNGLRDTMYDLIVDGAGALLVARLAYSYIRTGRSIIFSGFVGSFVRLNPQLKKWWG
jgi:hypothetical protein